jgi:plasmid stabilization system protein ParE
MKPVVLSDEALDEMGEAAEWYENRRSGLGDRFLAEADLALAAIGSRPASFRRLATPSGDLVLRRAFLDGFPYAVVFQEMQDEVRILALAHVRRRPDYWLYRLAD